VSLKFDTEELAKIEIRKLLVPTCTGRSCDMDPECYYSLPGKTSGNVCPCTRNCCPGSVEHPARGLFISPHTMPAMC